MSGFTRQATLSEHDAGICEDDCLECQVHKERRKLREAAASSRKSSDDICKTAEKGTRLAERITEERDKSRESQKIPRSIVITGEHQALQPVEAKKEKR